MKHTREIQGQFWVAWLALAASRTNRRPTRCSRVSLRTVGTKRLAGNPVGCRASPACAASENGPSLRIDRMGPKGEAEHTEWDPRNHDKRSDARRLFAHAKEMNLMVTFCATTQLFEVPPGPGSPGNSRGARAVALCAETRAPLSTNCQTNMIPSTSLGSVETVMEASLCPMCSRALKISTIEPHPTRDGVDVVTRRCPIHGDIWRSVVVNEFEAADTGHRDAAAATTT
jgi:hypothetical protein